MAALTPTFLLPDQPEVFLSDARTSRAGAAPPSKPDKARKVGPRLYTRNTDAPLEQVVRRNWQRIAALYFPGAVVVDRSAVVAKPTRGRLALSRHRPGSRTRREPLRLPGLTIRPRSGPGPVRRGHALHGWAPLLRHGPEVSRQHAPFSGESGRRRANPFGERSSRTSWSGSASVRGTATLNELRDKAREVAEATGRTRRQMEALDDMIGAILGTHNGRSWRLQRPRRASQGGRGFDPRRIELFDTLQAAAASDHPSRSPQPSRRGRFPSALLRRGLFLELDRGHRVRAGGGGRDRLRAGGARGALRRRARRSRHLRAGRRPRPPSPCTRRTPMTCSTCSAPTTR